MVPSPADEAVEHGGGPGGELVFVDPLEAVVGDRGHDRIDASGGVGAAGRGVLVGGRVDGGERQVECVVAGGV